MGRNWLATVLTMLFTFQCLNMSVVNFQAQHSKGNTHLENSAFFLITSFRVARTAAIVSSDVPWSCCGFPDGNFCTRSLIAYLPGGGEKKCHYLKYDPQATASAEKLTCLQNVSKKPDLYSLN